MARGAQKRVSHANARAVATLQYGFVVANTAFVCGTWLWPPRAWWWTWAMYGVTELVAVGLAWAVRRFTAIPAWGLSAGAAGFMGLWLARAPWPGENYAGSSVLVLVAGCVAVAALAFPDDER